MLVDLQKTTRSGANKFSSHCAELRQLSQLAARAKLPESTQDALRSEIISILDSRIITYPPILQKLGITADMSFSERKDALGVESGIEYTAKEEKFLDLMKDKSIDARKAQWRWRIAEEAEQKRKAGWYPFFVTLTVNPSWTDPETLWKEGREFRKYIRKLVKVVCSELGHPPAHKQKYATKEVYGVSGKTKQRFLQWDYRPESEYVTYAGVLEHGQSREHHHMHLMIWMKEIPDNWKQCPNRCIVDPQNRTFNECKPLRRFWKWSLPGLSIANYYRSKGDIWHDLGFAIPFDVKRNQPMKIAPGTVAGAYMAKYMQKDFKQWHHRVKATRNLGLKRLKKLLTKLSIEKLEALSLRPNNSNLLHSVSLIHSAPLGLVRSIAKQETFYQRFKQNRLDSKWLIVSSSGSYMRMLRSVRLGARPDRMDSLQFYDWLCRLLPAQKGYCEDRLLKAHELLRDEFPRLVTLVQPKTLPGNNYGCTSSL